MVVRDPSISQPVSPRAIPFGMSVPTCQASRGAGRGEKVPYICSVETFDEPGCSYFGNSAHIVETTARDQRRAGHAGQGTHRDLGHAFGRAKMERTCERDT